MFTEPEFKTINFPVEVDQTVQKVQRAKEAIADGND